jgi:hypothetical protein
MNPGLVCICVSPPFNQSAHHLWRASVSTRPFPFTMNLTGFFFADKKVFPAFVESNLRDNFYV